MLGNSTFMMVLTLSLFMFFGCSGGKMEEQKKTYSSIKDVPESTWQSLAQKRIYFGHQSVGFNILDGIKDVMRENPQIKLNIVETTDPAALDFPVLAHSRVGKNMDPKSKCDAFADSLGKGLGNKADIAFFKFCYVDAMAETNVDKVFDDYKATMAQLKTKYPQVKFVHMTVPVTTLQTGWKAVVKKILGRSVGGIEENIKREFLNERIRSEYGAKDPVFDLAKIESTLPDGSRASFTKDGRTYYSLAPQYTDDGGHLNEIGRKWVAEQLLILLANVAG